MTKWSICRSLSIVILISWTRGRARNELLLTDKSGVRCNTIGDGLLLQWIARLLIALIGANLAAEDVVELTLARSIRMVRRAIKGSKSVETVSLHQVKTVRSIKLDLLLDGRRSISLQLRFFW